MKLAREFREFIAKGNVIDLAAAVIIGAAFSNVVTALSKGILMPIVGKLLPGGDWRTATVTSLNLEVGQVLAATLDFLITALIVFLIVVKAMSFMRKKEAAAPPPADVVLLGEIRDLLAKQQQ
jgi:large conductance mechanosensitive channel